MKHFTILISFIFLTTAAHADDAAFKEFVTANDQYSSTLNLAVKRVFNIAYPQCDDTPIITKRVQQPLTPIMTQGDKSVLDDKVERHAKNEDEDIDTDPTTPIYGQWLERALVKACDKTSVINHLAVAYDETQPVILPLLNGKTRLDAIDQPLAEKAIMEQLNKSNTPCEAQPLIIDTDVIGYRTKDNKSVINTDMDNGWFEKWDIRACDTKYDANIAILPDPKLRFKYIVRLKPTA